MKTLLVVMMPAFLLCGCGVKEGAEFYSLQKQDDRLADTVSNLQARVEDLAAQNKELYQQVNTNFLALGYLIKDERQNEVDFKKLQDQVQKIQKQSSP